MIISPELETMLRTVEGDLSASQKRQLGRMLQEMAARFFEAAAKQEAEAKPLPLDWKLRN